MKLVVLTFSFLAVTFTFAAFDFQSCVNSEGKSGVCKPLNDCAFYINHLRNTKEANKFSFIIENHCGSERPPWACCPEVEPVESTKKPHTSQDIVSRINLPRAPECGSSTQDRIHGGNDTGLQEFPWMALIQFLDGPKKSRFYCGGSLITNRHILTAAHCVPSDLSLSVRLGEWDMTTNPDCIENIVEKVCAPAHEDIKVVKKLVHKDYSSQKEHDIALLKLERSVEFSKYIKPICLDVNDNLNNLDNVGTWVAGWGFTEDNVPSDRKMKVYVVVKTHEECKTIYGNHGKTVSTNQLCAGGTKGKDSCNGDSGGPLMTQNDNANPPYWFQGGIVSYGPTNCGTEGIPGIYTRISKYMDWIQENIEN